jgi:hypothetical protein
MNPAIRAIPALLILSLASQADVVRKGVFTYDGKSIPYRVYLPDGHDTAKAAGVFIAFHGNNDGTQAQVMDLFAPSARASAKSIGYIPVVVASPKTQENGTTMHWYDEDTAIVHRLIASGFNGSFRVDMNKVVFSGSSQGTCFLNLFLPVYWRLYGGGLYGGCGCHNEQDFGWQVDAAFKSRFKVFVHNSQGDFLLNAGTSSHDYYKWIIGLDSRGRFDEPTDHCQIDERVTDSATLWLGGKLSLSQDPKPAHWERVAVIPGLKRLIGDRDSTLWASANRADSAVVLHSRDAGRTWEKVWGEARQEVNGMVSAGPDTLLISTKGSLVRIPRTGAPVISASATAALVRENDGTILRQDPQGNWTTSKDGIAWKATSIPVNYSTVSGATWYGDGFNWDQGTLFQTTTDKTGLLAWSKGGTKPETMTKPGYSVLSAARSGDQLFAWSQALLPTDDLRLLRSDDAGKTWNPKPLPFDKAWKVEGKEYWKRAIRILPDGALLTSGAARKPSFRSLDGGTTWSLERGFWSQGEGRLTRTRNGTIYAIPEDGSALMRWIGVGQSLSTRERSIGALNKPSLQLVRTGGTWRLDASRPAKVRIRVIGPEGRVRQNVYSGSVDRSMPLPVLEHAGTGLSWLVVDGGEGERLVAPLGL